MWFAEEAQEEPEEEEEALFLLLPPLALPCALSSLPSPSLPSCIARGCGASCEDKTTTEVRSVSGSESGSRLGQGFGFRVGGWSTCHTRLQRLVRAVLGPSH